MKALSEVLGGALLALALGFSGGAAAVVITYQATDLPNLPGQGDRWQYSYKVSGSFVAGGGFNVLFSPLSYSFLQAGPAPNPNWFVRTEPPLPPADTLYVATALAPDPSLAGVFTVSFDWLGGPGTPGSQPFEVFDESFSIIPQPGNATVPLADGQVPLPGTLGLLGLGLLALGARKAVARNN